MDFFFWVFGWFKDKDLRGIKEWLCVSTYIYLDVLVFGNVRFDKFEIYRSLGI